MQIQQPGAGIGYGRPAQPRLLGDFCPGDTAPFHIGYNVILVLSFDQLGGYSHIHTKPVYTCFLQKTTGKTYFINLVDKISFFCYDENSKFVNLNYKIIFHFPNTQSKAAVNYECK